MESFLAKFCSIVQFQYSTTGGDGQLLMQSLYYCASVKMYNCSTVKRRRWTVSHAEFVLLCQCTKVNCSTVRKEEMDSFLAGQFVSDQCQEFCPTLKSAGNINRKNSFGNSNFILFCNLPFHTTVMQFICLHNQESGNV